MIVKLPLKDWPRLEKFTGLEHFNVSKESASAVTDAHVKVLSRLTLPKLRQVSLAHCRQVTDEGLQALTNLPSIRGFQLIGTSITDRGMHTLATGFPKLGGINVEECKFLSEAGFFALTNSQTITSVGLSFDPFSQAQLENIISIVSNVTWWTISDPRHRLDQTRLRELGESRQITIQVADDYNSVKGITHAPADGVAKRGQRTGAETNSAPSR